MEIKPGIFISIASYRDPELLPTLLDLINNASGYFSLSVSVCWQDEKDYRLFQQAGMELCEVQQEKEYEVLTWRYAGVTVRMISLHYFDSKGACWARNLCETLYRQEDYFLQIDSHCRFAAHWDSEMVTMLEQLKTQSNKPVLSTYPPGYEPGKEAEKNNHIFRLVFRGFSSQKILQLTSIDFQHDRPLRGSYLAGGFIFAEGSFVKEVPNDPQIFFEGEEIAMAARAFTQGYEVWHPHKALLWHFYSRKDFMRIWGDHTDAAKKSGSVDHTWYERDEISKNRVRTLLGIAGDNAASLGKYGPGDQRTLEEFEAMLGVDFKKLSVLPEVVGKERIGWFPLPAAKNWRQRLTKRFKKTAVLLQSDVNIPLADIATLHIGIYSDANDLLFKKLVSREEIADSLTATDNKKINTPIAVSISTLFKPAVVRFTPWDENEGWGEIVEKAW